MAGRSKQCDFIFEGGLHSHTRASLIIELIKYVLYERNQIPLHFDGLKQQMQNAQVQSEPTNSKQLQTERKAQLVLTSLDDLFANILKAFETCPEIQQALVLLGSTTATPKEVYIVNLPSLCPEADHVSLKSSKQALFRHLVEGQIMATEVTLGPTNVMMMLSAPSSAILKGFVPKMSFKLPPRGYCLTLNMICQHSHPACQNLTFDDTEVEISGIEPFNSSSAEALDSQPSAKSLFSNQYRNTPFQFCTESKERSQASTAGKVCEAEDFKQSLIHDDTISFLHEAMLPHVASTPKPGHYQQWTLPTDSNCVKQSTVTHIQNQCIWFQYATTIKGYSV